MNDYRSYDRIENFNKYSAKKLFEIQLESVGSIIKINNKTTKGIITNEINPYAENKEDRTLKVWEEEELKKGDYIEYDNEFYLVISDIDIYTDKNYAFKDCKIRKCNQIIHMPNDINIPAIVEGESYGVKLNANNLYLTEIDTKVKITVGRNSLTEDINIDTRIILGNSKYGIYKIGDISTYLEGILVFISKKDKYREGYDDLEKGIAYNDSPNEIDSFTYEIEGKSEVKLNQPSIYKLAPRKGIAIWSVSEDSRNYSQIKAIDEHTVEVVGLKSGELIELKCEVEGLEIKKDIVVNR